MQGFYTLKVRSVGYKAGMDMKMGDIKTGPGAHGIVFSPDGSRAYVTNQDEGTLSVIDAKSHKVVKSVKTGSKPNGLLYRGN